MSEKNVIVGRVHWECIGLFKAPESQWRPYAMLVSELREGTRALARVFVGDTLAPLVFSALFTYPATLQEPNDCIPLYALATVGGPATYNSALVHKATADIDTPYVTRVGLLGYLQRKAALLFPGWEESWRWNEHAAPIFVRRLRSWAEDPVGHWEGASAKARDAATVTHQCPHAVVFRDRRVLFKAYAEARGRFCGGAATALADTLFGTRPVLRLADFCARLAKHAPCSPLGYRVEATPIVLHEKAIHMHYPYNDLGQLPGLAPCVADTAKQARALVRMQQHIHQKQRGNTTGDEPLPDARTLYELLQRCLHLFRRDEVPDEGVDQVLELTSARHSELRLDLAAAFLRDRTDRYMLESDSTCYAIGPRSGLWKALYLWLYGQSTQEATERSPAPSTLRLEIAARHPKVFSLLGARLVRLRSTRSLEAERALFDVQRRLSETRPSEFVRIVDLPQATGPELLLRAFTLYEELGAFATTLVTPYAVAQRAQELQVALWREGHFGSALPDSPPTELAEDLAHLRAGLTNDLSVYLTSVAAQDRLSAVVIESAHLYDAVRLREMLERLAAWPTVRQIVLLGASQAPLISRAGVVGAAFRDLASSTVSTADIPLLLATALASWRTFDGKPALESTHAMAIVPALTSIYAAHTEKVLKRGPQVIQLVRDHDGPPPPTIEGLPVIRWTVSAALLGECDTERWPLFLLGWETLHFIPLSDLLGLMTRGYPIWLYSETRLRGRETANAFFKPLPTDPTQLRAALERVYGLADRPKFHGRQTCWRAGLLTPTSLENM